MSQLELGWLSVSLLLALPTLQGCVYLPTTTVVYDADCQVTARRMVLQPVQIAAIGGCSNEGCAALLVAAGATAAVSAVISETIVVAGNVVYWFEKQGHCVRQRTAVLYRADIASIAIVAGSVRMRSSLSFSQSAGSPFIMAFPGAVS
jgi:hypothetical protein